MLDDTRLELKQVKALAKFFRSFAVSPAILLKLLKDNGFHSLEQIEHGVSNMLEIQERAA
jgi:Holliday junction resolvase